VIVISQFLVVMSRKLSFQDFIYIILEKNYTIMLVKILFFCFLRFHYKLHNMFDLYLLFFLQIVEIIH